MPTLVFLLAVLVIGLALIGFLSWLLVDTMPPTDDRREDEEEETLWLDPRSWPIVDRLFGDKPPRLVHKDREGCSENSPADRPDST